MRRRILKKLVSILLACMMSLTIVIPNNVSIASGAVVLRSSSIKNYVIAKVWQNYPNGYCLKFVEETYQNLGATRPYSCCASKSGNLFIRSQSRTNIPIGATVYFGNCGGGPCRSCGSSYYGHVGIYVGDGYFVHATGGKVQKSTISSWANKYRGYGYCGNFNLNQDINSNSARKPSYSNFWLSKKDTSYTEYGLNDNVEVNVEASNYDHLTIGIDKDGVGRVVTKEISSHYVFSAKDLGVGSYSVYVTVSNSQGYVDTNTLWFKIQSKPTYSNFWLSKKDTSYTEYCLGDNIEVNVESVNYDHLTVGINKDGVGRVVTKEITSHYVFSSKDLGAGNYNIYVTVSNSQGYVDTNTLWFSIRKPQYDSFTLSKTSYELGENMLVNVKASYYNKLVIGIDKDGVGRVVTKEIPATYKFSTKELGVGNYSMYVSVYNQHGYYTDTKRISFKINPTKEVTHVYGNWEVIKSATCTTAGTEKATCKNCGKVETRIIKATGHTYKNMVVSPTTTQKGYTLHICAKCGNSYKDNYTNAKKLLQSITITEKPSKLQYYRNDKIDTTGMKVIANYSDGSKNEVTSWKIAGTTTQFGKQIVTVSYSENGEIKTTSYEIKVIERDGEHVYDNWIVINNATCITEGTEKAICKNCGKVETRTIKATGHSYKEAIVPPTATQKGYTLHTCSNCGYSYKDNYTNVKKQLQSITITTKPDKLEYYLNESLDTTGIKVVANYSDGSKNEVKYWRVSGTTASVGKQTITISYSDNGITKTASYDIQVKEKDVKKEFCTIVYATNGGSMSQTIQTGEKGKTVQISSEKPVKSIAVIFNSNGASSTPNPLTLQQTFKRWICESVAGRVRYYAGDSLQLNQNYILEAEYSEAYLDQLPEVEKDGYSFEGWYTENNEKAYVGMAVQRNLTLTAKWIKTSLFDDSDLNQTDDENKTLAVGDEITTDTGIYTITKMNGTPTLELTEWYDDESKTAVIRDCIVIDGVVYTITSIGAKAFYKNDTLEDLFIGYSIKKIDKKAFYGCKSLKSIVIDTLHLKSGNIGADAFKKVNKNVRVYVPKSKYKTYKKLLKRAGIGSKAAIYKLRTKD